MSEANKYQVGGDHYNSEYKHWDWAVECGLNYLEGTVTKYLPRWRKKGGVQDLEKSYHYLVKLIECAPLLTPEWGVDSEPHSTVLNKLMENTNRFVAANGMTQDEKAICYAVAAWRHTPHGRTHLAGALETLRVIMEQVDRVNLPKPVPAEDSNKHALHKED